VAAIVYHPFVIRRFYVHNFRCLENFELPIAGLSSVLLIGNNGSGKTSVGLALGVLQKIARGTNQVGELVKPKDLSHERSGVPIRLEIEVELGATRYGYEVAFELAKGLLELRVLEERLTVNGAFIYTRKLTTVHLAKVGVANEASFNIDWHLVALPIIQPNPESDPASNFRRWLSRMLILRPIPSLILGDSELETLEPNPKVLNFGAWFSGVLAYAPSAYSIIDRYLKQVIRDFAQIRNPVIGAHSRSLLVAFSNEKSALVVRFEDLSDGEKCFMICALVLAASEAYDDPVLCFWDEPDNYLALSEVQHFVLSLRKAFKSRGQFIATSHNPEAIRSFSDENTFLLYRNSHLEPTVLRPIDELKVNGDLVGALTRGDLEP
jgi:ABC-type Mn2+/Zn2+ transport system ATPase subunit